MSRRCARSKTVGDRNADCDDHCVYYYCALVAVIVCTASSLLQTEYFAEVNGHVVKDSFKRLGKLLRSWLRKAYFVFLLAFFFYIDGVYTVIDMATAYGQALGLDSTGLLLALLVTQIVAFPSVLIFGRIVKKVSPEKIITVCIMAYFGIAVYAYWLDTQFDFWMLAVLVGMFQGTIQALSRSYFAKIIPAEKSGEYFGIYDICGKGASVIGTALVSFISQMTGSINIAVSALSVMIFSWACII